MIYFGLDTLSMLVKIGATYGLMRDRLKGNLSFPEIGNSRFENRFFIPIGFINNGHRKEEFIIHRQFSNLRVTKEWFELDEKLNNYIIEFTHVSELSQSRTDFNHPNCYIKNQYYSTKDSEKRRFIESEYPQYVLKYEIEGWHVGNLHTKRLKEWSEYRMFFENSSEKLNIIENIVYRRNN